MLRKALLCLVTDRTRLVASAGRPPSEWRSLLLAQIEGAIRGGVDLVQIRERDLASDDLCLLVRSAMDMAAGCSTRILVNDRLDIALAMGAHGLHLREDSLPAGEARRLAEGPLIIGRSVHSSNAALAAGEVDYLIAGAVLRTIAKPDSHARLGLTGLQRVVEAAGSVPVLAIGGITEGTLGTVVRAGAAGVAAIGAFLPLPNERDVAGAVQIIAERMRFAFDSASAVS